ncbi:MAG: Cys-tRNA(Pro) deacylase [Chloroflexota bacterium]|nr:MAG: Cys-tRNA(Pro) deacylase [Chloroflexota bacterium]
MPANNVTRFLDSHSIQYTIYELPKKKLGADEVAQILDVPLELVYKSIVVERAKKGKAILAVIPGGREVNLKALAKATGEKKVKAATQAKAEALTKLQAGGISPLALINKGFDIFLDASAKTHEEIYISGGERGMNIRLAVSDLLALIQAKVAEISH